MFKLSKYNYVVSENDEVYIYNILKRSFLCIPNDLWECILLNNFEELNDIELEMLLKYGVILHNDVVELYVMQDILHAPLMSKENMGIFLSMTSDCNFICPYCYQDCRINNVEKKYISKQNIDLVSKHIRNSGVKNCNIVYFGGEPTLNQENLIYAMDKIENIENVNVQHSIITNGFILTDEMLEAFRRVKSLLIQITIDGDKENHDKYRILNDGKKTFDIIYDNVKKLANMFPNCVSVRGNISLDDYKPYYDLVNRLVNDGLDNKIHVWFEQIFDGQINKNSSETNMMNDKTIELLNYTMSKGFDVNMTVEYGPCLAHSKYGITIDENLRTYYCPGQLYQNEIGYISTQGDHQISKNEWYKSLFDKKPCVYSCEFGPLCYGGCLLNGDCRKETIKKMLPIVVSKKIQNYKEKVNKC